MNKLRNQTTPAQLIAHRGKKTQEEQAALWNTALPTYQGWEWERRSIPGTVTRIIALERQLKKLENKSRA